MTEVVGIRFKRAGPVSYYDPAGYHLEVGDQVVVETQRGLEIGFVVIAPEQVVESELEEELRPIVRKASEEDLRQMAEYQERQAETLAKCAEKVAAYRLPMKLLTCEYTLDGSRLTVYFSAEGRVDFRELVRDLASTFQTKVELRQVGPRDEAKLAGGCGRCGLPLCCANHLSSFSAISIRMAKMQDLPLNPAKMSGVCGRLLCCLQYENDFYREMKESMPDAGERVLTPDGAGRVVSTNVIKASVAVMFPSSAVAEYPLDAITPARETPSSPVPRARRRRRRRRRSSSAAQTQPGGVGSSHQT